MILANEIYKKKKKKDADISFDHFYIKYIFG